VKLKKILKLYIPGALVVLLLYIAVDVSLYKPVDVKEISTDGNFTVYKGAIHIHTVRSDGTGTVQEIADAARCNGIDYIIISDHDAGPSARDDGGYYDGVLVMVGSEISVPEAHILYIPHPDSVFHQLEYVKKNIYSLRNQAIVIIAHPFLPKRPLTADRLHLTDGMEMLNADSIWRRTSKWRLFEAFVMYPFMRYSMNTMVFFPHENKNLWLRKLVDGYSETRIIGSVDAHANIKLTKTRSWKFPSYDRTLRVIQTHIVLNNTFSGNYDHDARLVYNAIKNGNTFISYENMGNTTGFEFYAQTPDTVYSMGSSIYTDSVSNFTVRVPGKINTKIYIKTPEQTMKIQHGPVLTLNNPEPGIYFAEVYQLRRSLPFGQKTEHPWIITNTIEIH